MKEITLTRSMVTIVEDADYTFLSQFKWYIVAKGKVFYAASKFGRNRKFPSVYMHRVIMAAGDGFHIDHVDGDGLNNRRCNLRFCTNQENHQNMTTNKGTSKYKGVSWDRFNRKWIAGICSNARRINLGRFENELDAALAYDKAAVNLFGKFARTNFSNGLHSGLHSFPS